MLGELCTCKVRRTHAQVNVYGSVGDYLKNFPVLARRAIDRFCPRGFTSGGRVDRYALLARRSGCVTSPLSIRPAARHGTRKRRESGTPATLQPMQQHI
ncbi:hypothetical protein RI103_34525 [Paraburkholderia sp. FT54]|uniref:hypothetical protein n=1 Tax=Paraburkholderia sp. FT54 TaxID=3074437 RepID=UPI0028779ECE|nr:hypothetical protein [Paraburkholderia sp. FT54]WNC94998.1 hypothetical protein RI103_34525 [Paraburkholderia sp. FT54]